MNELRINHIRYLKDFSVIVTVSKTKMTLVNTNKMKHKIKHVPYETTIEILRCSTSQMSFIIDRFTSLTLNRSKSSAVGNNFLSDSEFFSSSHDWSDRTLILFFGEYATRFEEVDKYVELTDAVIVNYKI